MEEKTKEFIEIVQKCYPKFSFENVMDEEHYLRFLKRIKHHATNAEETFQEESIYMVCAYLINKMANTPTTAQYFEEAVSLSSQFTLEWLEKLVANNLPKVTKDWTNSLHCGKYVDFEKFKKSLFKYVKTNLIQENNAVLKNNADLFYGWDDKVDVDNIIVSTLDR